MMSRIGNKNRAAFTLIEIMVTTVVFSLSAVLIYETYFRSLDLLNYCYNYLNAISWVDDKMVQAQNELTRFNVLRDTPASGDVTIDKKNFSWKLSYDPVGGMTSLYRIDSKLSWREGSKDVAISRAAYAIYEEEKK